MSDFTLKFVQSHTLNMHASKFIRGKIYLCYMSFIHIDMTQVIEIFPQVRQTLTYST